MISHKGECHCGKIRFMFKAPAITSLTICNCSICNAVGFQHVFVPHENFTLLRGENFIKSYRFGSGKAEHMFCTECGVKPFYQPRSHPDKYSINFRCLKKGTLKIENTIEFDGKNWEKNISSLKSKV